jgi:hypothetical protein
MFSFSYPKKINHETHQIYEIIKQKQVYLKNMVISLFFISFFRLFRVFYGQDN